MKTNKYIVLILGAGASKPYGLPLGQELRDRVIKAIFQMTRYYERYPSKFANEPFPFADRHHFATHLSKTGFTSIDSYLSKYQEYLRIGKYEIGNSLSKLEQANRYRLFPPNQPKDHWYELLWSQINVSTWSKLKETPLRVITFNYDRTFEIYFSTIIANTFDISETKASNWLNKKIIVHVHGSLGVYDGVNKVDPLFRPDEKAAKSIIVLPEARKNSAQFKVARNYIQNASAILFLGFGFHHDNMRRLGFPDSPSSQCLIKGSNVGIKRAQWASIAAKYNLDGHQSHFSPSKLGQLVVDTFSEVKMTDHVT